MITIKGENYMLRLFDNKIIIDIPIHRRGHDHDSTLTIRILDIPGVVDEREGWMSWQRLPKIEVSDPRFVEVIGFEVADATPMLPGHEVSVQRPE